MIRDSCSSNQSISSQCAAAHASWMGEKRHRRSSQSIFSPITEIVSQLTLAVNTALAELSPADDIPEATQYQLLDAIDKLRVAVAPPLLTIRNFCVAVTPWPGCHPSAMGMGIFDAFAGVNGAEMTAAELDEKTKGDKGLLVRIVRLLCANYVFEETGVEKYKPLSLAMMFASSSPPSEVIKHFYSDMKASVYSHEYLKARGYQNPQDAYDTPFQFAMGTKEHHFEWLQHNPEELHAFNVVMEIGNRSLEGVQWYDYYPWKENLVASSDADRVLLVDIGGDNERLIVQDLPKIIEDITEPLLEGIEAIGYNMFDPQPVRGAKAYYLRTVLHDWPDKQALQALARVREAMAADSVLLINENVLPESGVSGFSASMDIIMEIYGALERTEKQWLQLLDQAGFKVVKVWRSDFQGVGSNALFEAVPN
ncbi:S-adenosyl-L-methionine-dependent methyltransferase [Aspergillus sclerotioniger CBS 115572]|uniref:S-adenosyl-L-methionine-dependent methyltransferase n=1 Tax=Aspergillus sclerotioniger CBS 115572 TaxID=1450535 RepID=A0A317X3R2_9EURO|nr:S-adenosyl-L-methionine-dependent methyltransferase [Aspergillus sclerotioniger CBS 115572]PWY92985.1 S-adenosyl-L-methionine-dependent methyltransferase [Aspergillus sclerotioniger CBS 115572]